MAKWLFRGCTAASSLFKSKPLCLSEWICPHVSFLDVSQLLTPSKMFAGGM